ncbi:MAG: hypothetical protein FJZ57_08675 [Chlamydiae bacterium]|nr:hypothetical protein [Chlamydiota bacterium]
MYDWIFRKNNLYPDKILGSKAYQKAEVGKFLLGQYGAGIGATVGKSYTQQIPPSPGGQGGSFRKTNGIKLAAFTVLNSLGDIYGPFGDVIYGAKLSKEFKENHIFSSLSARDSRRKKGNTTLSLIVTNVNLEHFEMRSLARQMHNSFAEVIRPYGTIFDGDTLYFVSTKEIHLSCRERDSLCFNIGLLASDLIKEAVYSAVNIDR